MDLNLLPPAPFLHFWGAGRANLYFSRSTFPLGGEMKCERQSTERQATTTQLQRMQLCQCQIIPRPLSLTPLERRFATVTAHVFVFMPLTNSLTVEGASETPRAGISNAARLLSACTGRCQRRLLIIFQLPRLFCSVLSFISCFLSQFLQAFPKGGFVDQAIFLVGQTHDTDLLTQIWSRI